MAELDKILKARTSIVLSNPFFASILLKRDIIEDNSQPTAYTDGKTIGYNRKFMEALTPEEIKGVFIHEVKHIILLHMLRKGNRHHMKANIAMDLAINPLILDYGFSLPKRCLIEPEFKGMAFEQIYDKLPEPITMSMSGKGEGDEQSQGIERNGKTFKEFDDVRSPKNADGSELSEGQMKEIEQEIKIDVQQAYQIAKKQGNLPAGMERWIKDFLEPTINWREVLAQFIVQNTRNDYSWNRPNKRYLRQDLYAPSLNKPEIGTVAIGIDTSGSIGQKDLDTFASEVKAILGLYCNKVFVIYCDSKVAHVDEFDNPNDIELKPYGGGGTACTPVFSYIQKHEINPVIAIHFTDGYVEDYETKVIKEADYDILWVLSSNSNKHFKPSTGTVVEIK